MRADGVYSWRQVIGLLQGGSCVFGEVGMALQSKDDLLSSKGNITGNIILILYKRIKMWTKI